MWGHGLVVLTVLVVYLNGAGRLTVAHPVYTPSHSDAPLVHAARFEQ